MSSWNPFSTKGFGEYGTKAISQMQGNVHGTLGKFLPQQRMTQPVMTQPVMQQPVYQKPAGLKPNSRSQLINVKNTLAQLSQKINGILRAQSGCKSRKNRKRKNRTRHRR